MIIQIRGTSGSGKSTVMRQVMDHLSLEPVLVSGRKRPLYYLDLARSVAVLGHYESPCGGCDTIGSARQVYDLIQTLVGLDILAEGLLLSEDTKWSTKLLEEGADLRIAYLTTPLDRCLKQIQSRRVSVGNLKELNTENTSRRVAVIERSRVKLLGAGARCLRTSPELTASQVLKWLRLHAEQGDDNGSGTKLDQRPNRR